MPAKKTYSKVDVFLLQSNARQLEWEKRELDRRNRRLGQVVQGLMKIVERSATHGDTYAQNHLGDLYYWMDSDDIPVKQNYRQARAWYQKAAKRGDPYAQKMLGILHAGLHQGIKKNGATALKWFQRSAAQNDTDGLFFMGNVYRLGIGVKKDLAKAQEWYKKAAAKGHASARQFLKQFSEGKRGLSRGRRLRT